MPSSACLSAARESTIPIRSGFHFVQPDLRTDRSQGSGCEQLRVSKGSPPLEANLYPDLFIRCRCRRESEPRSIGAHFPTFSLSHFLTFPLSLSLSPSRFTFSVCDEDSADHIMFRRVDNLPNAIPQVRERFAEIP